MSKRDRLTEREKEKITTANWWILLMFPVQKKQKKIKNRKEFVYEIIDVLIRQSSLLFLMRLHHSIKIAYTIFIYNIFENVKRYFCWSRMKLHVTDWPKQIIYIYIYLINRQQSSANTIEMENNKNWKNKKIKERESKNIMLIKIDTNILKCRR